ncbi:hypothetical protein [Terrihalobacillus insolitus]|nr:hypothetical protein [Terrihalobacillus insolitus]MDC3413917.1 hypothetical protein [Terrihalobacillus insolitus]
MLGELKDVLLIIATSLGIYKLTLEITSMKKKNKKKRPSAKGRKKKK